METILSRFALFLEIDQRTDVHAAHGAMAVVAGDRLVTRDDFAEALDELRQFGRRRPPVSSTKAIGFLSPLMPSSKPSPALRTPQIALLLPA